MINNYKINFKMSEEEINYKYFCVGYHCRVQEYYECMSKYSYIQFKVDHYSTYDEVYDKLKNHLNGRYEYSGDISIISFNELSKEAYKTFKLIRI